MAGSTRSCHGTSKRQSEPNQVQTNPAKICTQRSVVNIPALENDSQGLAGCLFEHLERHGQYERKVPLKRDGCNPVRAPHNQQVNNVREVHVGSKGRSLSKQPPSKCSNDHRWEEQTHRKGKTRPCVHQEALRHSVGNFLGSVPAAVQDPDMPTLKSTYAPSTLVCSVGRGKLSKPSNKPDSKCKAS